MIEHRRSEILNRARRFVPLVLILAVVATLICVAGADDLADTPPAKTTSEKSTPAKTTPAFERFPDEWFFQDRSKGKRRAAPAKLEGKPLPKLELTDWIGDPVELDKLEGKIVIVDFWGTWCPPCMRSIPKNVKLVDQYKEKDVVFIGVHSVGRGFDKAEGVVKSKKINYPVAQDDGGKSARTFKVSTWPTYIVSDQHGTVRAAGLLPDRVDDVVKVLYEEREAEEKKAEEQKKEAEDDDKSEDADE